MDPTKDNTQIIKIENDTCILNANSENVHDIVDNVLKNIKFENITNLISEVNKAGLYRFAITPEGGYLYQYTDGTVSGVWRNNDTGKILKHGKLKQVDVNLGNIFKIAANQAMLAFIIVQLNEINEKLDLLLQGQHNDRIAEIDGAIKSYEYYANDKNPDKSKYMSIILNIETGISKLESELNQLSDKLNPKAKFSDNWFSDKNKSNLKNYNRFTESIGWIFKGYETLMKIDLSYNEHTGVDHFISFLENGKWDKLAEFARGMPYKKDINGYYPEEKWEKISKDKPVMIDNLNNMVYLEKTDIPKYEIEFNGNTLVEALSEMQEM